jgi:hypothetical protein
VRRTFLLVFFSFFFWGNWVVEEVFEISFIRSSGCMYSDIDNMHVDGWMEVFVAGFLNPACSNFDDKLRAVPHLQG